ncbi:MAG: hypothetical protein LUD50_05800 [Clostridia bacterium]|nr:hypothetical protein [Clostridia bacterium]
MDYELEYDTTKVDTPENRRAMHWILGKYFTMRVKEGHTLKSYSEDVVIGTYLRILGDYLDPELSTTEGLERALDMSNEYGNETYFLSFVNHLRFTDVVFVSSDASPDGDIITRDSNGRKAIPVYTRSKWIEKDLPRGLHWHHASMYDILDQCDWADVDLITINSSYNKTIYSASNIKAAFENFDEADTFWNWLRQDGINGEDLFPLLAQDFLYRDVSCIYGRSAKRVTGRVTPYKSWQKPGYNIETSDGKTVYVSLDDIRFIRALPDEEGEE